MPSQYCGRAARKVSRPEPSAERQRLRRAVSSVTPTAISQARSGRAIVSIIVGPICSLMMSVTGCLRVGRAEVTVQRGRRDSRTYCSSTGWLNPYCSYDRDRSGRGLGAGAAEDGLGADRSASAAGRGERQRGRTPQRSPSTPARRTGPAAPPGDRWVALIGHARQPRVVRTGSPSEGSIQTSLQVLLRDQRVVCGYSPRCRRSRRRCFCTCS